MEDIIPEVLTELDVVADLGELRIKPGTHSHTHSCSMFGVVDTDTDTSE